MFLNVANLCIQYPGALTPAVDNVTLGLRATNESPNYQQYLRGALITRRQ